MQNEYQLRLKDLNYNEKLKEATEKFTQELDGDKKNYELLLQAKNDMEMEYEERIKTLEERHQQQLQALEAQYQQKIMAEVERYQQLVGEKDLQGEKWEERLAVQAEEHERSVQELTDESAAYHPMDPPPWHPLPALPSPPRSARAPSAGYPPWQVRGAPERRGGGARAREEREGGVHPGV